MVVCSATSVESCLCLKVPREFLTSFVITDPKGSLIGEVGQLLVRCGYRVKVLNTINFSKSMRYNPFRYEECISPWKKKT